MHCHLLSHLISCTVRLDTNCSTQRDKRTLCTHGIRNLFLCNRLLLLAQRHYVQRVEKLRVRLNLFKLFFSFFCVYLRLYLLNFTYAQYELLNSRYRRMRTTRSRH